MHRPRNVFNLQITFHKKLLNTKDLRFYTISLIGYVLFMQSVSEKRNDIFIFINKTPYHWILGSTFLISKDFT